MKSPEGDTVTIPDEKDETIEITNSTLSTPHTEIQGLVLKLGNDMGFDVWVARNDKGKDFHG